MSTVSDDLSEPAQESEKLAFVLSGGGSLGSVQVGCLEALLQQGIFPDLIVGTSVGALNGAFLAKDPTLKGVTKLKEIWLSAAPRSLPGGPHASALTTVAGSEIPVRQ